MKWIYRLIVIGICSLFGACTPTSHERGPTDKSSAIAEPKTKASTYQYEKLLLLPQSKQNRLLKLAINSIGEPCPHIIKQLFVGVTPQDNAGNWAVACSDGTDWMVAVHNDASASTSVTSCATMKLFGVDCWVKF